MEKDFGFDRYRRAHRAICEAALPSSTELVAHRLLTMVGQDEGSGQVNMSWEVLAELTGCENVNAARRHLSRLLAAKLIHYSTNDYVYVTWLEWMIEALPARPRAGSSALARQMEEVVEHEIELFGSADAPAAARQRADQRVGAPLAARGRAGYSHARLLVSQSVDPTPATGVDNKLTNMPKLPGLSLDEQRRSVTLLTDVEVGLDSKMAWHLAQRVCFEELVRHVMSWRRQVNNGMVSGPGALVHRIRERFGAMVADDDRKSALFRRHHGREDWYPREECRDYSRWNEYTCGGRGRDNKPEDYLDLEESLELERKRNEARRLSEVSH